MRRRYCKTCGQLSEPPCPKCKGYSRYQSRQQRGYDYRWEQVRNRVIADNPLCVKCEQQGKVQPAREVHHIVSIKEAPHLRLDRTNLIPLCEACHDAQHGGKSQRSKERSYAWQKTTGT